MLGDISSANHIYLVTGYTDMRKNIDGLIAIVCDTYELDPYSNSVFLFCGRRADRIKVLHYEGRFLSAVQASLERSNWNGF